MSLTTTSNALTPTVQTSAVLYTPDKVELLKNTICKGISNNDFDIFLHVCKHTGLDPFMKQIYAVPRGGSMTIQTSIDGYRLIADRTGRYCPGREPTFTYDKDGNLFSATAYVKKQTADGTWHEASVSAIFSEYCQRTKEGKPNNFWKNLSHVMLAKVAESLCLRKCFPAELSGIYTKEEMDQADKEKESKDNEEITPQEGTAFQMKWANILGTDIDTFCEFMTYCLDSRKLTVRQCMDLLDKDPEKIKGPFQKWLEKKTPSIMVSTVEPVME